MSIQEILIIVGVGALASLIFGLLRTLCSGVASKAVTREKSQTTPATPSIETYDGDEGLVRASAGVAAPDPRAIIEEVASEFRRGLRREFEKSFWAGIWVNFFFFLLGSALSFLLSAGYILS